MFVTCSSSFFDLLPFAARKPCSFTSLPSGLPAIGWQPTGEMPEGVGDRDLAGVPGCAPTLLDLVDGAVTP